MNYARIKNTISFLLLMSFQISIISCSAVPVTGRKQLNLIPSSSINSLSAESYREFLSEHRLSNNVEQTQMVKNAGNKIQKGVEKYFAEQGDSKRLRGYEWEFNLVEDTEANAWCMPGGKVVVYTGILPITQNEAGLAVVMGHEIAHAIANHGNERMSQGLITELGGMALSEALAEKPAETKNLFMKAYGVTTEVGVLLPYSRQQESEADHLGLIFMAIASYDPHNALDFWKRMAAQSGNAPPEFLSTHPSDQTRIKNIESLIPEAMKYYRHQ